MLFQVIWILTLGLDSNNRKLFLKEFCHGWTKAAVMHTRCRLWRPGTPTVVTHCPQHFLDGKRMLKRVLVECDRFSGFMLALLEQLCYIPTYRMFTTVWLNNMLLSLDSQTPSLSRLKRSKEVASVFKIGLSAPTYRIMQGPALSRS